MVEPKDSVEELDDDGPTPEEAKDFIDHNPVDEPIEGAEDLPTDVRDGDIGDTSPGPETSS
jgi:hypothetical protein